jgi:hypothetical protein
MPLLNNPSGSPAWKHLREIVGSRMSAHQFAQHLPEIRRDRQVGSFIKLLLLQSRPFAVHFAAA